MASHWGWTEGSQPAKKAELAARGRSSREIADLLTVSVRTVDSHLHHTYVKLGVRDRAGLAAALAPDPDPER